MKTARIREMLDVVDATVPKDSIIEFRVDCDGGHCHIRSGDFFRIFGGKHVTRKMANYGTAFYDYRPVDDFRFHCCLEEEKKHEVETITLPAIEDQTSAAGPGGVA
jgi:hypothetical protein